MILYIKQYQRKKIAIFHYAFLGGGAEAVALWMLEALKDKYELTLFTTANLDFPTLNLMYGTQLAHSSIKIKSLLPAYLKPLSDFLIANNGNLRKIFIHILIRYFKACQREYDLVVSAYNAMDLGRRGIQYIHWVRVIEGNALHHQISNFSEERLQSNISVANSHTVAEAAKKTYSVECLVVYPPVTADIPQVPWQEKENAFICSGRLTQAKQPHQVIQILNQVRAQGFQIKLYLTGGGGGAYARQYKNFVTSMVEENSDWVTLYKNLPYKDYLKILAKCKYGIHFKSEPFGISVAEMVKAGAIPFVRSKGGQIEIVGEQNDDLLFANQSEAVSKIVGLLRDYHKQRRLLQSLEKRKSLFSTDKFVSDISKLVASYFSDKDPIK
ncbi:MAG: glycosyltransferase [Symploca sp. SIO2C1]|nr:glycosyltransferase [Symploca sp. SIO2C1]